MDKYTRIYRTLINAYPYTQIGNITQAYLLALSGNSQELMAYNLLYTVFLKDKKK